MCYNVKLEENYLMDFQSNSQKSYTSEIVFLSLMTLIFGFCCLIFGYLALPLAAGFYAALLSLEKKENRIISYILPLIPLTVNVFINGFYSLEAIAYVAVGAMIFFAFSRKKDKAFAAFIVSATTVAFFILSFMLISFDELGTFRISAFSDFYLDLYEVGKAEFVDFVTSLTSTDEEGIVFYRFTASDAVDIYNTFIIYLIPVLAIFAFVTTGVSMKILSSRVRKYAPDDKRLSGWHFITTPFLAYAYIIVTVLVSLSSDGVVGLSLSFVSVILMAVYFYIGLIASYAFVSAKRGRRFAFVIIAAALVVFSSLASQIISFIGVFVNNALYKSKEKSGTDIS